MTALVINLPGQLAHKIRTEMTYENGRLFGAIE